MLMKKDYVNLRKSKLLLLTLLAVLCGGASPAWADELTIFGSATSTHSAIPIYGYNADTSGDRSEFVVPSSMLSDMSGKNITGLTFYCANFSWGTKVPQYQVYLKEVESETLTTYAGETDATTVYTGEFSLANSIMTVTFTTPYTYNGGHLLIGTKVSTTGSYIPKTNSTFYGSTSSDVQCNKSSSGTGTYFLPKTTFIYETISPYKKPATLTASSIMANSAVVNWTAGSGDNSETGWDLEYKASDSETWTEVHGLGSSTLSYTLNGLSELTSYNVRVKALYGENESDWRSTSFQTLRAPITTFPWSEDFNSLTAGIPDGWDNTEGTVNTINNRWIYYASGHDGACVRFNSYNNNDGLTNFLKTPVMSLPAGKSMQLKFWYKNPTGGDFSVYISNDGGATYTTELATGLTGASTWTEYEATIPVGFTDNVVIVFKGTSNYGNGDAYIYLDDVEVSEAPACPKPTGLTASDATYNSVVLAWTAGSDETEWKVIYGAAGFDPASEGTTINNVTTNPYTLTGLDSETAYDVYVKAVKGSDVSPVSNKASFTTTERYPTPTGLAISNLTTTSATLTWTAGAATSWEVAINTTGETPATDAGTGTVVNTATYDFSELTTETTYYAFVREKDGENFSSWSAACEFTPSAYTYLTLNEGTNTNSNVPITVNTYGSSLQRTQFVIPATNLTEMINKNIKKLTFYATTESNDLGGMEYDVYLKEVDNTTITSSTMTDWETMTNVYSGTLSVAGGKMNILLSADYAYTGKSLLVGIYQKTTGTGTSLSFYGKLSSSYMAVKWDASGNERTKFSPKTTIGYQAKTGSELKVFDGETELTASPASFDFGLATAGTTHTFTLKNTAATPYVATISSTNLTVSPTELTPTVEGVTFTVAMPEQDITDETVVITPAAVTGLEPFTINVSGTLRDASKLYQEFAATAISTGWTADGTWNYSETNGAYTTAWFIDSGTLTRLKTPMLTVAAGEKFIVEAKGYSTNNTTYQHLVLQYSADGTTWTTFSDDFGTTISTDPTNWKSFTATLPNEVEAGNYYIGILASQANIRLFYGGKVVTGANFAINIAAGAEQDFGQKVNVGAVSEKTYTITNNGNANLVVSFTDADDFKVVDGSAGLIVPAYSSATFTVQMVTTTQGEKSGNIMLTFDALNASSFTIPCKGTVLDPNYLIVDFSDGQFPEGWTKGADWSIGTAGSNSYAVQSNTKTPSALITTPLTVTEGETLTFKVARNASGQGNVTSLKTRYSTDGGATWSDYTTYEIESTGLTEKTLTGVPAGTVSIEFLGCNVKLDDIQGFTKTTASALLLTDENGAVVEDGDTKDFGNLKEDGVAVYTLRNIGNVTVDMMIIAKDDNNQYNGGTAVFEYIEDGVTSNGPAYVKIPAGKSVSIKLTAKVKEPYGEQTGTLKIYFDGSSSKKFAFVNYRATIFDPTEFVEDFEKNSKPAGWYNDGWTISGGKAYVYAGTNKVLITEKVNADATKNKLSFEAKAYAGEGTQTLNVYTSTDRITWSEAQSFTLTSTVQTLQLGELEPGNYYVKFEAANAAIDNLSGLKRIQPAPEHDLYVTATSIPAGLTSTYAATATVTSLRADETDVYAELWFDDDIVATDTRDVALDGSATFTLAPETVPTDKNSYQAKIVVYYSNGGTQVFESEPVVVSLLRLNDTYDFIAADMAGDYAAVKLNRSFNEGWGTVVLPFDVSYAQVLQKFGEGTKLFTLTGYNEGTLSFNKNIAGNIVAGTPYLINLPAAIAQGELVFENVTITDAVNNQEVNGAQFKGNYDAGMSMDGKYGITPQGKLAKGTESSTMKAFRAYIELPGDVSGVRIMISGETTGIDYVLSSDELNAGNAIYNLQGQRVEKAAKGFYIIRQGDGRLQGKSGKKVFKK